MGGMAEWLRTDGARLDPTTTLVLGLDTLGAGEPIVAAHEGWSARYDARDLALADRGATLADLPAPKRFGLGTSTDPMIAKHAGFPALSILSQKDGTLGKFHLPVDQPDNVDWESVRRCTQLAAGIIASWTSS